MSTKVKRLVVIILVVSAVVAIANLTTPLISAIATIVAIIILYLVISATSTNHNLVMLNQAAEQISKGNLNVNIPQISSGETAVLAKNLECIQHNFVALVNEVERVGKEISAGNWHVRGDKSFAEGASEAIISGVNRVADTIFSYIYNTPCVISAYDSQARFIYYNESAKVLGFGENTLGKTLYEVSPSDSTAEVVEHLKHVIKTGKNVKFEQSIFTPTGEVIIEDYFISPIRDDDGNIIAAIIVNFDVSAAIAKTKKVSDYQEYETEVITQKLREGLDKGILQFSYTPIPHDTDTVAVAAAYGKIGETMNHAVTFIKGYVDEISQLLGEFSNENFDVTIYQDYIGDFGTIKRSMTKLINSIGFLISEIQWASEQAEIGAVAVSDSSNKLSANYEQQVQIIGDIRQAISSLSEKTDENVKKTRHADSLSTKVQEAALAGNKLMQDMSAAMADIKQSSAEILGIVRVIDGIAFQTNLLALNASVEAARAGEHGKGFSVVADEVRNLAARSATAAKETADLLNESINRVNTGVEISVQTAQALQNIGSLTVEVANSITEIAQVSHEQAGNISKINSDMETIYDNAIENNGVIQANSATSQELSAQSAQLSALVAKFTVGAV